jgi:hypothetical protein
MCHKYIDTKNAGISGHAQKFENSSTLGQCSRCLINIPLGHSCGEEKGKLVCGSRVREKNLPEYRYSPALVSALVFINNLPRRKIIAKIAA